MIQDSQVTRHDLVLQDSARRDVNTISVVGDDDHGALKETNEKLLN